MAARLPGAAVEEGLELVETRLEGRFDLGREERSGNVGLTHDQLRSTIHRPARTCGRQPDRRLEERHAFRNPPRGGLLSVTPQP